MKALLKEHPGPGLALRDIPAPAVQRADDVQFRVACCAICVGEMKVYDWDDWAASDPTLQLPTVLGHEAAGVVTAVGAEVTQFQPGDRIVVDPLIACGHCYLCRKGQTNMCLHREIYGKRRGAFADYAVLPQRALCPLPAQLSFEEGALLENLGIAVHAVEIDSHDPGDTAVVVGCGPIGIMAGKTLEAYGCRVVMTDLAAPRLAKARQIIDGLVIDVRQQDPAAVVREMTDDRGADFVIEAAATQAAFDQALALARNCGTVVTIGSFGQPVTFNPFFSLTRREIRLQSVMGRTWETWRRMVQLVESAKIDLSPFISHVLPLEAFEQGFALVRASETMKVVLRP